MNHIYIDEKAAMLNSSTEDPEYGFDEQGNKLRYVKFSAEKLKQLREECKMSQEELAKAIGKNRTTVTNYESGVLSKPSFELLVDLGRVFSSYMTDKLVFYVDWEDSEQDSN